MPCLCLVHPSPSQFFSICTYIYMYVSHHTVHVKTDPTIRTQAEQALKAAEQQDFLNFAGALATELSGEDRPAAVRQLAGIHFKNLLHAKDEAVQTAKHDKWKTLDGGGRAAVKALLLQALRSPEQIARHTAAQAAAEMELIEAEGESSEAVSG